MGNWRYVAVVPVIAAGWACSHQQAVAQAEPPPTLGTLQGVSPPKPPEDEYRRLVKNVDVLRVLGKALFWDSAVGSDGIACASCHFNAGADPRVTNQLSPGIEAKPDADLKFGETQFNTINVASPFTKSGTVAGPNITLKPGDFPFHHLQDPTDRESAILYDTNDVTSSQGTFEGAFLSVRIVRTRGGRRDFCDRRVPSVFSISINGKLKNVRKVEPRNTPTAINAAFFFRNFWDGRANNVFNGVDPLGRRTILSDPNARIVVREPASLPRLEALELKNMSLASQAVGPPRSDFEMSCAGREFADIGRKLLNRIALAGQRVAGDDSLLGGQVRRSGRGLRSTYQELVQGAFQDRLWNDPGTYKIENGSLNPTAAPAGYTLSELNFSMFFGLAIDAYERTLISDRTPFDRHEQGDTAALNATEKQGLELFKGQGKCIACHVGPLLSGAAVPPRQREELIENMIMGDGDPALYDGGFYNIGVRPTFEDLGLGAVKGNAPLAFSRQLVDNNRVDEFPDPEGGPLPRIAVDGAFKTPTLRNVGLTAPYFHNGGEATLRQVVEFYNRGGNRRGNFPNDTTGTGPLGRSTPVGPSMGGSNLDADIQNLGLDDGEIDAIVAFLLTLTDRRVACHQAPFDHPELIVGNGHRPIAAGARARDVLMRVPAVGRGGYGQCDKNSGDLFDRNLASILQPVP